MNTESPTGIPFDNVLTKFRLPIELEQKVYARLPKNTKEQLSFYPSSLEFHAQLQAFVSHCKPKNGFYLGEVEAPRWYKTPDWTSECAFEYYNNERGKLMPLINPDKFGRFYYEWYPLSFFPLDNDNPQQFDTVHFNHRDDEDIFHVICVPAS